jgi:hypothetical protein
LSGTVTSPRRRRPRHMSVEQRLFQNRSPGQVGRGSSGKHRADVVNFPRSCTWRRETGRAGWLAPGALRLPVRPAAPHAVSEDNRNEDRCATSARCDEVEAKPPVEPRNGEGHARRGGNLRLVPVFMSWPVVAPPRLKLGKERATRGKSSWIHHRPTPFERHLRCVAHAQQQPQLPHRHQRRLRPPSIATT